ncbi:MAG: Hydrazine synthase subunit beta [Phycisphaerales bacterium]|nr:Hydrazine synthase subunit beta [Phycisphaerales bacterium]
MLHALLLGAALALQPSAPQPAPQVSIKPPEAGSVVVFNKAQANGMLFRPGDAAASATVAVGDGPHEVAISGGRAVVSNYGGPKPGSTLTVIDLKSFHPVKTISLGDYRRPHGLAFFKDGRHVLVTAEVNQSLIQVNVDTGEVVKAWETGQHGSHMVVLSPDEKTAYVTNVGSGSVTIIDLAASGPDAATTITTAPGAEGLALSPDGGELWVANNKSDSISILDTKAKAVTATMACEKYPLRVAFTPDGKHVLAAASASGDIIVYDAATRKELRRIATLPQEGADHDPLPPEGPFKDSPVPIGIAITPDGGRAYTACTATGTVAYIDLSSWTVTSHLRAGKAPDGIGLVPGV